MAQECLDGLGWSEARAVFTLLGELRELGRETAAWRGHLLQTLAGWVGAKVGIAAECRTPFTNDPGRFLGVLDVGWLSARERSAWWGNCAQEGERADPCDARLARIGNGTFTHARPAFAPDDAWYGSFYFNEHCRPARIDHFLLSHQLVPRFGALHSILLYREAGERPFSEKELRWVDRLHAELAYLWQQAPADAALQLPPRLRQTLAALQAGDSEREAADRLGISPATLHDHVRALHRRFGVRSRGELLARTSRAPAFPWLALMSPGRAGASAGAG